MDFTAGRLAVTILTLLSLTFSAMAARDLAETFPSTPPAVPASIQVPRYQLVHTVFAKGHQFYQFNGSAWLQFNATAKLYDIQNHEVGSHFYLPKRDALGGQPTWQSLPSKGVPYFSSVTCRPVSSVVVDKASISWVLLETTRSEGDRKYFGEVALVQRYETKGGLAPTSKQARAGAIRKSRYTSFYSFYVNSSSDFQHH
ncbi:hypothetical protein M758_7G011100 [Ceratodon purpureus]|uniref:Uncharacterized protein n=1 Tax=Ceratodon purpureus TaxID=3225 RepID=A0A8T0H4S0_CERPU|nr:hypothetical protein KC19_7G011000 [Ceratodon purpureus]KAG0609751.1 hypothetical protein M758_7G011100 [Ceratodon purpureus]